LSAASTRSISASTRAWSGFDGEDRAARLRHLVGEKLTGTDVTGHDDEPGGVVAHDAVDGAGELRLGLPPDLLGVVLEMVVAPLAARLHLVQGVGAALHVLLRFRLGRPGAVQPRFAAVARGLDDEVAEVERLHPQQRREVGHGTVRHDLRRHRDSRDRLFDEQLAVLREEEYAHGTRRCGVGGEGVEHGVEVGLGRALPAQRVEHRFTSFFLDPRRVRRVDRHVEVDL
jgi:hypothetical protein